MNPPTNPPSNTADAVLADAAAVPVDALDAILRQIVNGYFVLTDGQGSVSKWSEPAELLFDQPTRFALEIRQQARSELWDVLAEGGQVAGRAEGDVQPVVATRRVHHHHPTPEHLDLHRIRHGPRSLAGVEAEPERIGGLLEHADHSISSSQR